MPNRARGPTLAETREILRDGSQRVFAREWVPEAPVALEFNGLSYAVMMATPADLEDFARGFAITEGLARAASEIGVIDVAEVESGWIVRTQLSGLGIEKLTERVRMRVAESSCGLCGIENLEALAHPLPKVPKPLRLDPDAIFSAVEAIGEHQPLNRQTAAAHAAGFALPSGELVKVREDVGRHNAVDKLIGALAAEHFPLDSGFFISTARCSYEIVEKIVRAGGCALVTISLPTSLAAERARDAGLSVYCLAREDSFLDLSPGAGPCP